MSVITSETPVIDFSLDRSKLCALVVKACKEFGFFQIENHGVSSEIISAVEKECQGFFSKPAVEKQRGMTARSPFGYGCKNIGFNGDQGELEYILLEANPQYVCERSKSLSIHHEKFSNAMNDYIIAVRNLTCDILDIVAEGLHLKDKSIFRKLIRDDNSDCCFRINHYPPAKCSETRIGFGEHSDPQIITILRSNDVAGLQILSHDGLWMSIPPDADKFCVFVGDAFHSLTNGKFMNVRHRALANSTKERTSIVYFAAPPLSASISPISQVVSVGNPSLYRPFTWGEYKNTFYSLRLADHRLDYFRN